MKNKPPGKPTTDPQGRRDFLVSLGKWSGALIATAALGGCAPYPYGGASWINGRNYYGGGGWINRRGGWINGRHWYGRGGGWINRRGGGGGWINHRGGYGRGRWINRRW